MGGDKPGPCEGRTASPLVDQATVVWCDLRSGHAGRHEARLPGGGTVTWPSEDLEHLLLTQAREGDAAVAEVAELRIRLQRTQDERDRLIAAHQHATQRYRLSLDQTLNGLIGVELEAGNDERAAALRCLRAWNRGAGYVIQRRIP